MAEGTLRIDDLVDSVGATSRHFSGSRRSRNPAEEETAPIVGQQQRRRWRRLNDRLRRPGNPAALGAGLSEVFSPTSPHPDSDQENWMPPSIITDCPVM